MHIVRFFSGDTPARNSCISVTRMLNQHSQYGICRGQKATYPVTGLIQSTPEPDPASLLSHWLSLTDSPLSQTEKTFRFMGGTSKKEV